MELGIRAQKIFWLSLNAPRRTEGGWCLVIGASGSVRHLIPRFGVEISDIKPGMEVKDVEEAVKGFFDHGSAIDLEVSNQETHVR